MLTTVVLICWGNGAIPYHFLYLLTVMPPPGISLGFIEKEHADSYLERKHYIFFLLQTHWVVNCGTDW